METVSRQKMMLSTLTAYLYLVGYVVYINIVTTPETPDEQIRIMNRIYYVFFFIVMMSTLYVTRRESWKRDRAINFYLIIVIGGMLRFVTDYLFKSEVTLTSSQFQQMSTLFFFTLFPIIAITRCYKFIDFRRLWKWTLVSVVILIWFIYITNPAVHEATEERLSGGNTDTILFGHIGVMGLVVSYYAIRKNHLNLLTAALLLITMWFSFLVMLRAGSRGPILSLVVVAFFAIMAGSKNKLRNAIVFILVFAAILSFWEQIVLFIGRLSPVLYERFAQAALQEQTESRDPLFLYAIEVFKEHPIFGYYFAKYGKFDGYIWTHNLFTDIIMQLGIFGLILIIYVIVAAFKRSGRILGNNLIYGWIALIFIQRFMLLMTSKAWYLDSTFNAALILVLLPILSDNVILQSEAD